MTYNIRGGLGIDGKRSTRRIADAVSALSPEIVCFQEVHQRLPQSAFVDQPRYLEEQLRMRLIFQANLHIAFGGYGLAIASCFPILQIQNHSLPSLREQRGALEVMQETPLGLLTVFCTHWGLNAEERERQALALSERVREVSGAVIVCGDLNEALDSAAVQTLLVRTGFGDADSLQNRVTYPADKPSARIDYILHSKFVAVESVSVVATLASDHLPVVADFSLASAQG